MTNLIHQVKQSAPDAHIAIVQVTARKDKKGIMKQVIELNQELKQVVQREQVGFVSTSFYQTEHCGMKGVHPNAKGVDLLYETLDKYVRKISHECYSFDSFDTFQNLSVPRLHSSSIHNTVNDSNQYSYHSSNLQNSQIPSIHQPITNNIDISKDDWFDTIKKLKLANPKNLTCSYLNINSIRNKFHNLVDMIDENIDIICISETKLDDSFPASNFLIPGYSSPFRLDVSSTSGGILVFIKENIPSKLLTKLTIPSNLQILPIEVNLRKTKWLILPIYKPPSTTENYFLDHMNRLIEYYTSEYDNILTLGDFNMETSTNNMDVFMKAHSLKSLFNKPTCYKSKEGRCIDLLLTNKNRSFKFTNAFETGLSDHHLMIYTMFRTTFEKIKPIDLRYRSFKKFDSNKVANDLLDTMSAVNQYDQFESSLLNTLNTHAPIKTKKLRSNTKPFTNQILRKAISVRSKLKNIANKTGLDSDLEKYKKQRNYVVSLNRKTQKAFFKDLNPNNIQTSKSFFQTFKPYFSKKYTCSEKLLLIENNKIISDDKDIATHFNNYFANITGSLGIIEWPITTQTQTTTDPILNKIYKYIDHPSIQTINSQYCSIDKFSFREISKKEIKSEIENLDTSKSSSGDIPIRFIKDYLPFYIESLHYSFNNAILSNIFPDPLKLVDVTAVFKKGDKNDKTNYRPISVMKAFATVFERLLFKQLNGFIESKFSPLLCGFRKGHNTQHALINLLEDWRTQLDNKKVVGTILCDLSKAFNTLSHDLMIAKLNAYGIGHSSLKFIDNYLTNRKQRCKVGSSYSSWENITSGVP